MRRTFNFLLLSFSVLFWLRKGRGTENMAPLYCRVTITGQRDKPHHRTDCEAPEETFRIMLKTGDIQNAQIFFAFRLFQRRQSS